MEIKCPTCNKKGTFLFFGEKDDQGVIAMVRHGPPNDSSATRCFIKEHTLQDTIWYSDFLKSKKEVDDKLRKENEEKWNKEFEEDYWRQVEKEEQDKLDEMLNDPETKTSEDDME